MKKYQVLFVCLLFLYDFVLLLVVTNEDIETQPTLYCVFYNISAKLLIKICTSEGPVSIAVCWSN